MADNMFEQWATGSSSDSTPMAFKRIGDTITIAVEGAKMVADKFADTPGGQVFVVDGEATAIQIDGERGEDGKYSIFVRSAGMKEAIGKSVGAAGQSSIELGDQLAVIYVDDKQLRNGKSMKIYEAVLVPAEPIGVAAFGGETEARPF